MLGFFLTVISYIICIFTDKREETMTDYLLNQDALTQAHNEGLRFFIRIQCGTDASDFVELVVEQDGAEAEELAIRWLEKHQAISVATYRILPDGKRNLIRIYDYRDLEAA
tara:strand:- start:52 stop:384 length:333 start_codon:yes stop_codon:yes gene_type:complete